jgi:hypothetical protein
MRIRRLRDEKGARRTLKIKRGRPSITGQGHWKTKVFQKSQYWKNPIQKEMCSPARYCNLRNSKKKIVLPEINFCDQNRYGSLNRNIMTP